ncbi:WAS/WASL-interacting protein family member 1 isoform X1 [Sesamum indicum]|uniref:WAS/WASL-interacting protein family member 1 isoform X1 n=1 Tax=Sesamum indicum TaxID=4182 RepID=A0A6I9TNQ6_SESIN|nr:WAS/WASL-interacting protein family member 1 isoform X1 [Sesamum indicum]XP_020550010.1 WAS/WASL-interacting protein family member 1 isoform X1 [Sesamum indicum]
MAQEEQILRSSYSGSGGGGGGGGGGSGGGSGGGGNCCSGGVSSNRSKNVKQKKVPQRGLGVAQLEKIRLEEQRKKEALQAANVLANNAIGSPSDTASVQCPNFGSSLSPSPNSVPLPQSPTNFPSPNALYRSAPPVPVQITKQLDGELGLQLISGPGNGNWPRLWNGEYSHEGENQRVEHLGFAFRPPQVNLPYETNAAVVPLPSVPQRSYQLQRPSSSSSVVNFSSGISPSSVLSSQMEPPSNQSLRGNSYTSSRPEEDKMVGMKRSYPFSLESPTATSFPGNFHPAIAASRSRSDELPSCSSEYTVPTEPRNKYMRDGPSNSSPLHEQNPSDVIRDNQRLNGDFLTLAPPVAASPPLNSKYKHPSGYSGHQGAKLSDFKYLATQENLKSQIHHLEPGGSTEQPFSFFPVKLQSHVNNGNGEKGETIDLNLKL